MNASIFVTNKFFNSLITPEWFQRIFLKTKKTRNKIVEIINEYKMYCLWRLVGCITNHGPISFTQTKNSQICTQIINLLSWLAFSYLRSEWGVNVYLSLWFNHDNCCLWCLQVGILLCYSESLRIRVCAVSLKTDTITNTYISNFMIIT